MSDSIASYILLSLPSKATPESAPTTDINEWLERNLLNGKSIVNKFSIPSFKIGTLDQLVLQSEELAKIDEQLAGAVAKVVEVLSSLYENNQPLVNASKKVDDKFITDYLEHFQWKTGKFKTTDSIKDLIALISNQAFQLDADLRSNFTNYTTAKSNLVAAEKKQSGDLSVRSLHDIVKSSDFVLGSDHLQTVLVAVPKNLEKEFLNTYESLTSFVVPRSANLIKSDAEYHLYGVTLFKKYIPEYLQALREKKFVPRDFVYSEELLNELKEEHNIAAQTEHRLRNDLIRSAKVAYSDISSNWFHLKAIRVFIESVLRYGLPPDFNSTIIKLPSAKNEAKAREELFQEFGYLGGNAFSVDKKGKVQKDSSLTEYASLVDPEYEPFVVYNVDIK